MHKAIDRSTTLFDMHVLIRFRQLHGPGSPEGVGSNPAEVVAIEVDHGTNGSLLNDARHVFGGYMFIGSVEAVMITLEFLVGSQMDKTVGASFHRTKRVSRKSIMM